MSRKVLSLLLKASVATGLIYFMVKKGLFDMSAFHDLLKPGPIVILLILAGLSLVLNNYRWMLLLKSRGFLTTFKATFEVQLIGNFFNYALPGSVGGDVVRAYYFARDHADRKVEAVTSVIVDRVLGLYAMVVMAFIPLILQWHLVQERADLHTVALVTFIVFFFMSLFFAVVFSRRIRAWNFFDHYLKKFPGGKQMLKVYDGFHQYRGDKLTLVWAFLMSFSSQAAATFFMYAVGIVLKEDISLATYFFAVPLGFIIMSIPVSIAGLGIGQMAFLLLFQMYSGQKSVIGQTAITAFQLALLIWGLVGAYLYLRRKRPSFDELAA